MLQIKWCFRLNDRICMFYLEWSEIWFDCSKSIDMAVLCTRVVRSCFVSVAVASTTVYTFFPNRWWETIDKWDRSIQFLPSKKKRSPHFWDEIECHNQKRNSTHSFCGIFATLFFLKKPIFYKNSMHFTVLNSKCWLECKIYSTVYSFLTQ